MSSSEAFVAFYTLLLGLGLAGLLTGFAGVMRRRQLRQVGISGWLLSVLIIFEFLTGWSGATRSFTHADAKVLMLLAGFGTGACYFLASVLIFPEPGEQAWAEGVGVYIADHIRMVALLLLAANVLLVVAEIPSTVAQTARDPFYLWGFYAPYNGAILLCYAAMARWPRHRFTPVSMIVLLVIYGLVTGSSII